jgi:hypothetical protein
VELAHINIAVATCPYCETVSAVHREGADPMGKSATLIDFMAALKIGDIGTVKGRRFQVMGRVRYEYADGYWDEWYLVHPDGTESWLEEDEGELTLVGEVPVIGTVTAPESVRAGESVQVNGKSVYVVERGRARVAGLEGQVPNTVRLGQELGYIDGTSNGQSYMVEFLGEKIHCFVGEQIDFDALVLENS